MHFSEVMYMGAGARHMARYCRGANNASGFLWYVSQKQKSEERYLGRALPSTAQVGSC